MRKASSDGVGTVLPSSKGVKPKRKQPGNGLLPARTIGEKKNAGTEVRPPAPVASSRLAELRKSALETGLLPAFVEKAKAEELEAFTFLIRMQNQGANGVPQRVEHASTHLRLSRRSIHRQYIISHNDYGEPVWLHVIALDRRAQADASGYAAAFGLPMETFLEQFFGRTLPGQVTNEEGSRLAVAESELNLSAFRPELIKRLGQAAKYDEITVAEFVARAVEGDLGVCEELFLLHPETGVMLAENERLESWKVFSRWIGPARWSGEYENNAGGSQS